MTKLKLPRLFREPFGWLFPSVSAATPPSNPDPLIVEGWDADDDFDEPWCPTCGGYMEWVDCWSCGGEGERDVYEEDPMWYEPGDTEKCTECNGAGGYWECASLPHEERTLAHANAT